MPFRDPYGAHRIAGIPLVGDTWRDMTVANEDLAGVIFQNCTFERVRFESVDLFQTMFVNSRVEDCVFDGCRLLQTRWVQCEGSGFAVTAGEAGELAEALFSEVRFAQLTIRRPGRQVVFGESAIDRIQFDGDGCRQDQLTFSGCTFGRFLAENAAWNNAGAVEFDFDACELAGAIFEHSCFIRAAASGCDLGAVSFVSCNLYQSDFSEARIRRAEGSIFAECELENADFREGVLDGALFSKVNAPGARFDGAQLKEAMFPKAVLTGASFAGATAPRGVWTDANLADASLERLNAPWAILRNASFAGANVSGACFVNADLHGVQESLDGADLRDARGTVDWRAEREAEVRAMADSA